MMDEKNQMEMRENVEELKPSVSKTHIYASMYVRHVCSETLCNRYLIPIGQVIHSTGYVTATLPNKRSIAKGCSTRLTHATL